MIETTAKEITCVLLCCYLTCCVHHSVPLVCASLWLLKLMPLYLYNHFNALPVCQICARKRRIWFLKCYPLDPRSLLRALGFRTTILRNVS